MVVSSRGRSVTSVFAIIDSGSIFLLAVTNSCISIRGLRFIYFAIGGSRLQLLERTFSRIDEWKCLGDCSWRREMFILLNTCFNWLVVYIGFRIIKPPCQSDTACLQTALIQRLWFTWYLKPATFFSSYDYFAHTSFYFILSQSVVLCWSKPSIFKVRLHYWVTWGVVGLFQLGHIICIFI